MLTGKKPISKGHILYDSTYVTFSKAQNYIDEKQISGCQGLGMLGGRGGYEGKGDIREVLQ